MLHQTLMASSIALEILESGVKIPSLPSSTQQLLAISQQPFDKIDIKVLEKLIQKDPILFAQILKLANSSYYGTGKETTGLHDSIIRIGLADTVAALYLYLFKNALPVFPQIKGVSDKEYWEESWACALANRRLGDPRLMVEALPADLYIAGLLHGIGKLILAVYNPKSFYECIKLTRKSGKSLEETELEIFGTTDSLIAFKILESWHIPSNICAAVGYYQCPELAAPQYLEIAALTQFACAIVKIAGTLDNNEETKLSNIASLTDIDITELSNTYISKNRYSAFSDKVQQQKVIQEIISILCKQSAVNKQSSSGQLLHKECSNMKFNNVNIVNHTAPSLSSTSSRKKGFFSWLHTLFGR
ncbi:MAG: HDOD domain-containing protein [Desulfamplus sp.]